MRIELGCGRHKKEGFDVYIDRVDFGFNEVCDFEKNKLPFEDNSINFIWCNHVLEHMRDAQNILNECWRVLKPGGIFEVKVPYGLWPGASKPVHHQCITECWFDWLTRVDLWEWYQYRPWNIEKMNISYGDRGPYEIKVILTPRK